MSRSTFLVIAAVIALVYGLGFILAPAWTMTFYGVTLDVSGQWMARYLGSAFIGICVISYLARNAEPSEGLSAVMIGSLVLCITGAIVAFFDAISGEGNSLVWINVALYLLLAVGFFYYQFVKAE